MYVGRVVLVTVGMRSLDDAMGMMSKERIEKIEFVRLVSGV